MVQSSCCPRPCRPSRSCPAKLSLILIRRISIRSAMNKVERSELSRDALKVIEQITRCRTWWCVCMVQRLQLRSAI